MNRTKALRHRMAVAVVAAGLLTGGTASAFKSECFTLFPETHCNTLGVPPNSSTHTINMKVHSARTTYQLKDAGNQVTIRQGRTGGGWHYETIGGLFNNVQGYILYCESWAGDCEVNNN